MQITSYCVIGFFDLDWFLGSVLYCCSVSESSSRSMLLAFLLSPRLDSTSILLVTLLSWLSCLFLPLLFDPELSMIDYRILKEVNHAMCDQGCGGRAKGDQWGRGLYKPRERCRFQRALSTNEWTTFTSYALWSKIIIQMFVKKSRILLQI